MYMNTIFKHITLIKWKQKKWIKTIPQQIYKASRHIVGLSVHFFSFDSLFRRKEKIFDFHEAFLFFHFISLNALVLNKFVLTSGWEISNWIWNNRAIQNNATATKCQNARDSKLNQKILHIMNVCALYYMHHKIEWSLFVIHDIQFRSQYIDNWCAFKWIWS